VLTHYGHGPAPVFFGSGYVDLKAWWLRGLEIGVVLLIIYMGIGGLWMKVLGYY
jgi:DASS family divalent anion:Na+ symporter